MTDFDFKEDFLVVRKKTDILKLRSLGAGVEDADETSLTYLEAAYFADRGVLPLKKEELLKIASKKDHLSTEKYFVIRYLRDRGYIIRPSLDGTPYLRLHRKGLRPGEDKTYYLIEVVKKDWTAVPSELISSIEVAGKLRKDLAIAIPDPEHDHVTFIKFARMNFE
ncbi:hypothetical protein HZC07_04900 [Candidatus Micrarchaeota archaeon]|nr:hypothetical protein [Candidatus Micrarchaeota archaeon]